MTQSSRFHNLLSLSLVVGTMLGGCATSTSHHERTDRANQLAKSLLIVDTHIDVPYRLDTSPADISQATADGDFDYPRAIAGGLNAPFMSIYIPAAREAEGTAKSYADALIDTVEKIASASPTKFAIATSTADVRKQFKQGVISLPLGMENGAPIEGDLDNLRHFYQRGIRYITLTHSKSNHICDSSYDEARPWDGLSPFGASLIPAMNNIGVMVDISHVSDAAFFDVIKLSRTPVIASHSSARYFTPGFERNMTDDMIKALARNGGVIMINFGSTFINQASRDEYDEMKTVRTAYLESKGLQEDEEASDAFTEEYRKTNPFLYANLDHVLDHFDHVKNLVGIEYVGIGSDFDGVGDSLPIGLKDVSMYPGLIAGFLARGYTDEDIKKILGENLMRVWQQIEQYAAQH